MPGNSLVLRYVKDEIYHQMLVPSDHRVDYTSQIGIDGKVIHIHNLLIFNGANPQFAIFKRLQICVFYLTV